MSPPNSTWRTLTTVLVIIVGIFTIWRGVSYYLIHRSLRAEMDWLELQENPIDDWDRYLREWKARKLPPISHLAQKNEQERTKKRIRELEQRNDRNQFLLILAVGVLGIVIAIMEWLFGLAT